ncbi:YgjV family protein [Aeromonas enteropelogenes]|uniref:YgjV family protein n=1 Tax=Aeromonas enteropelogenes TaxID=29489 RepID=UPI003F743D39
MFLDSNWFAQSVGLLACLVGATAFMQRQDNKLRLHLTLNGTLMGLHFLLLGSSVAAINCLLCAVRNWVSGYYRGLSVMLLFLALAWLLVIPQITHPVQILTLLGTTLSTYALFRLNGIALRLCMLSSTVCWLTHNVWAGSIGGILQESIFFVINSHTIFKLYRATPQNA